MRKPEKARIKRYADRIVGSDAIDRMTWITAAALRASKGHAEDHPWYQSGYLAGDTESDILTVKYKQTDRDIQNFGDFLIDYGDWLRSAVMAGMVL